MIHQVSFENTPCSQRNKFINKHTAAEGMERTFYQNDAGDLEEISYEVFPGIHLVYQFVHMEQYPKDHMDSEGFVKIHYCHEGQLAWRLENEFLSLTPGKFVVTKALRNGTDFICPLGHYHGISIVVDETRVQPSTPCFLNEMGVNLIDVAQRLCKDSAYFSTGTDNHIENLFSDLYSILEGHQKGRLKIKVSEILMLLNKIVPEKAMTTVVPFPSEQAELANHIAEYLRTHIDRHITAEELSRQFHLSKTHLRNIFKRAYGIPLYSYIRIQKMQIAALQLARTSMTVLEIANACGYTNASKFTATFRDVMGETPVDYRKFHGTMQFNK